jgi:hypothetical protein
MSSIKAPATPDFKRREPIAAGNTAKVRKLFPGWVPALLAALYLSCILLVDPRGEFPLNDDWSYSRSAFRFAQQNRMQVDEFSAPSLVGQAFYGGLLARVFGAYFIVLRLSTLVMSFGTALLLWMAFRRLNVSPGIAGIAVLAWIVNPVQFCLAFTFMTEVHFLFFIALSVLCFLLFAEREERRYLIACGAAMGYAFLIRQTALLFITAAIITILLVPGKTRLRARLNSAFLLGATSTPFAAGYWFWMQGQGGSTPAASRKFELLRQLTVEQMVGNSLGLLFYLSFMLLPLCAYLIPRLINIWDYGKPTAKAIGLFTWCAIPCFGLWWFHFHYSRLPYLPSSAFHGQMPFLLNVVYNTGLGPLTLDPTYYGPAPTPGYPNLWLAITLVTAGGAFLLGMMATFDTTNAPARSVSPVRRSVLSFALLSFTTIAAFEVVFSHMQEGGLFDRHILIAALPLTLFICLRADHANAPVVLHSPLFGSASSIAVLGLLAWFSVTATHDYLSWNRIRWELGDKVLRQGVDPLIVAGGFEFNGWHNYDTFRARGNIGKIFYWWYDDPVYLITMEPQEGYQVLIWKEYYSWLHRRHLPLYLSKKANIP